MYYRSDTGRLRVYTGSAWADAGLTGPTGAAGGQELAYAEATSAQALTVNSTQQDITGLSITVPAGQPFFFEALIGYQVTSSAATGTTVLGTQHSFLITDSSNVAQATLVISYTLPSTGTNLNQQQIVRKRMPALASPTTYKVRITPQTFNISAFTTIVQTGINNYLAAFAR